MCKVWILEFGDFGFWGFWILDFGLGILDGHLVTKFWMLHKKRRLCTPNRVGGLGASYIPTCFSHCFFSMILKVTHASTRIPQRFFCGFFRFSTVDLDARNMHGNFITPRLPTWTVLQAGVCWMRRLGRPETNR